MPATEEILGDETPSDAVMGTVRGAVQSNEPILGIVVTSEGDALVATEQRLLIATEAELVLDTGYEGITDLEVRTGWWSRGITLRTSEAEFECDIDDRDAATAMGTIIGDRAPGLDPDDTGEDGGGLMGRAKGVFDTATGQDIRKFEEFRGVGNHGAGRASPRSGSHVGQTVRVGRLCGGNTPGTGRD